MNLPRAAVRRPVTTVSAISAALLLGSVALTRLPVALLPDVRVPMVTVRTAFAGAAPEELSQLIAEPIEAALAATPGLIGLRSISRHGETTTTARFVWGTDMRATLLTVRERLDAARAQLPHGADRPTLLTSDPSERPVAILALSAPTSHGDSPPGESTHGDSTWRALGALARRVYARRLEQLDGVAHVAVVGAPEDEVQVLLNPERLQARGLHTDDLASAIREANLTAPGGTVQRGQFRLAVRFLTEFTSLEDVRETPIGPTAWGLRLRDVGTVQLGHAAPRTETRLNGRTAIGLVIYKEADANTLTVTRRLEAALTELQAAYPQQPVQVVSTQARFVRSALSNLGQEILIGGVLSLLLIGLFLRNWRIAAAIGLIVPISILTALVALHLLGVTINVMSLGGLALGTGLLVDTGIVVAEAIGRRRDMGASLREAAVSGANDVAAPLIGGTLTTVLVFGPLIFVRGLAAALFRDLSLSVVATVCTSLVLSLTLLPVIIAGRRRPHLSRQDLPPHRTTVGLGSAPWSREAVGHRLAATYEQGLRWSLHHPRTVCGSALLMLLMSVVLLVRLPKEALPAVEDGTLAIHLALPPGTRLDRTTSHVARIESLAHRLGASMVYARVGAASDEELLTGADPGSSATAQLLVPLRAGVDPTAAAQALRAGLPDLARGALMIDEVGQSEFGALVGREGHVVRVELLGSNPTALTAVSDTVAQAMRRLEQVTDVRQTSHTLQPVAILALNRTRLAPLGIAPEAVVQAMSGALGGVAATALHAPDHRTPIMLRLGAGSHESLDAALAATVRGIPLRHLVTVTIARLPQEVIREGQRPVTIVEATVQHGGTAQATAAVARLMSELPLPVGMEWRIAGADDERQRTSRELLLAALMATVLVFLVLTGEFGSVRAPLAIMCTVPLAGAGALLVLWLTGQSLNAVSLIGIVVMIGMADNEAVVKMAAIEALRGKGCSLETAILQGGALRLRAIAMTSLTTLAGVLPLLVGAGRGGALYQPLAAGLFGGTLSAFLVTCFLLPTVYAALARRGS